MAASVAVLVMGPAVSWLWPMGMMPAPGTRPTVGFKPKVELAWDGAMIDPSVSVPTATEQRFVAAETADPELEPIGSLPSTYGHRVNPPRALQPLYEPKPRKFAHSDRFVLPRITAPASRSCFTSLASDGTRLWRSASDPAVVCIASSVAMLSFTSTGIPWSGPRHRPTRRSRSRRTAIATAAGFVSMTA